MGRAPAALLVVGLLLGAAPASAQLPSASASPPASTPPPAPVEDAGIDSPRGAVAGFLRAAREDRWDVAASALALDATQQPRRLELARRLKAVLDHHLWVDLEALSPRPEGNEADGQPPGVDLVGEIEPGPGPQGGPVRVVRRATADGTRWLFGPGTVARIDEWYERLPGRWLREHVPAPLLRPGPRELQLWQWLMLVPLTLFAWMAGRVLGWLTRGLLARAFARTEARWDDLLLLRLAAPLTFAWTLAAVAVGIELLALVPPAREFAGRTLRALSLGGLFWALWRIVDLVTAGVRRLGWIAASPQAQSLLGIGETVGKVGVAAMGVIATLSQLGYPVASLLAGLGIGGLAVALAAQKTVENLFGSVSLAADEPFRVGDFVKIDDFVGTVEVIGPRSTRVRTLDRTLVTLPNGRLADMKIENYTVRDRMRLACVLSLVYSCTGAQMRAVLQGVEGRLRAHPKIWPDVVVVRFAALGSSSLDVEVMAWFQTRDWGEFQAIREEVLLQFLEVVQAAGTEFAFPTRTVHLAGPAQPST